MEVSIKFKSQDNPENDLVSFSLEDVSVKNLGAVLNSLPETLAKSYATIIAAQTEANEDVFDWAEKFILSRCKMR